MKLKSFKSFPAIFLILLLASSSYPQEDKNVSKKDSKNSANNLLFEMVPKKSKLKLGEKIELSFHFKNISETQTATFCKRYLDYYFPTRLNLMKIEEPATFATSKMQKLSSAQISCYPRTTVVSDLPPQTSDSFTKLQPGQEFVIQHELETIIQEDTRYEYICSDDPESKWGKGRRELPVGKYKLTYEYSHPENENKGINPKTNNWIYFKNVFVGTMVSKPVEIEINTLN